jgi:chemotaxis protein CheC
MALNNYNDLNEMQLDVLREMGNIGTGNAAMALAEMLATPIDISVPTVQILDYEAAMESMGGPETMIVGLLLSFDGDINGMIMFLLEKDFAHMMINTLMGEDTEVFDPEDPVSNSALTEVGNIMAASYVNAIASMTNMRINLSVPDMSIDMLGAILSVPAIHYANISDKIIMIQNQLQGNNTSASNRILMLPDVDSLQKIMTALGIEDL